MEDGIEVREQSGGGGGFEGVADFRGVVGQRGGGGGDVDDAALGGGGVEGKDWHIYDCNKYVSFVFITRCMVQRNKGDFERTFNVP